MHMRKGNRSLGHVLGWKGDRDDSTAQIVEKFNFTIWSEIWVGSLPVLADPAMSNVVFSWSVGDTTELWCLWFLVFFCKRSMQKNYSFNASLGWKINSSLTCFFFLTFSLVGLGEYVEETFFSCSTWTWQILLPGSGLLSQISSPTTGAKTLWPEADSKPGLPVVISDVFCPNRWIPWLVFSFSVLVCLREGPSLVSARIVLQDALTEDFLLVSYFNNFPIWFCFLAENWVC